MCEYEWWTLGYGSGGPSGSGELHLPDLLPLSLLIAMVNMNSPVGFSYISNRYGSHGGLHTGALLEDRYLVSTLATRVE